MRVALSWLYEAAGLDPGDPTAGVDDLAVRFQQLGLLVEAIHRPAPLEVVVAEVRECRPIEGAKAVQLVVVDDGIDHDREVVCGAFNFGPGDKVPLARPGAKLPNGMSIAVRSISSLGVTSHGMLCAPDELGAGDDHSGILVLDSGLPLGASVAAALGLDETVVEFEITPNRPDCMSVTGIARELAASLGILLRLPDAGVEAAGPSADTLAAVSVEDAERCPRYSAVVVEGVTIGPSPEWLAHRLRAAGLRPINSVVDVTNYVMLELGQPLHAFDLDRVAGARIVVRTAVAGETIVTLDGAERSLTESDLLICDAERPVAIAGVMGGENSEVAPSTTRILIESAFFQPASVLQTSKRLGLRTDSSARFERGADPDGTVTAALRAARLMAELAGGTVRPGVIDVADRGWPASLGRDLPLRPERANAILGTDLSGPAMASLLGGIGIGAVGDGRYAIPSWRVHDLEREIDLVEEVARLHGYNNIPRTLPAGRARVGGLSPRQVAERRLRRALLAAGASEAQTFSFVGQSLYDKLGWGAPPRVEVANPLREDERFLRSSLVPTLLSVASYNAARGARSVRLAELGTVFAPAQNGVLPDERRMLGIVYSGADENARVWGTGRGRAYDVFDVKGVFESVGEDLGVEIGVEAGGDLPTGLHPARSGTINVGGAPSGWFGQLHPGVADAFDLPAATIVAEVAVDPIVDAATAHVDSYRRLSSFPAMHWDLAFVVDEEVSAGDLADVARRAAGPFCQDVELFDVFRGGQIPPGRKSLAIEVVFRSGDRTLTDADVKQWVDAIVASARKRLSAELRG